MFAKIKPVQHLANDILDIRLEELKAWLDNDVKLDYDTLEPASADASFRRYFRVWCGKTSLIAMDAPPEKEDCEPFITGTELLEGVGVHAPRIMAKSVSQGFLLLEDLGSTDYLSALDQTDQADTLYADAIQAMIKIQQGPREELTPYSESKLRAEMNLFPQWYLSRHLDHELTDEQQRVWDNCQRVLLDACAAQPQVIVHRDFHSRNLMVTSDNNPGVIDYQDMVTGPIAYDLASIFKDCYIQWPRERQLQWLSVYYNQLSGSQFSFDSLIEWYDLTGFQRHLKVLGIFCRLNYRDGKSQYLNDLPLVANYSLEVIDLYPQLHEFGHQFAPLIRKAVSHNA